MNYERKMDVLIDDERYYNNVDIIARTYESGMEILRRFKDCIDLLYLDHDLGHPQKTGYDILTWAIENGFAPDKITLVTMNPSGMKNMRNVLEHSGYVMSYGTYIKENKEKF